MAPPRPCEIREPSPPVPPAPPKIVRPPVPKPVPVEPPPAPPSPAEPPRQWFTEAVRRSGSWDRQVPPPPTAGNTIEPYIEVLDYYVALGKAIRATRPDIGDFVYIAGWGLDLDAFIDAPKASPRETLGTVLERAIQTKVDVRVLLPDQPQEGQAGTLQRLSKMGAGGILDPSHKLLGTHHQKFVVIRSGEGLVAFCGGCDVDNSRLGRDSVKPGATPATGPEKSSAWHDPQVKVRGPAVADMWNAFVLRYKEARQGWMLSVMLPDNPITKVTGYKPHSIYEPDLAASEARVPGLDMQVVRTYPNRKKKHVGDELIVYPKQPGYDFSPNGEMGVYRLLVRALSLVRNTIYLEDQYLVNTVAMGSNPPITTAVRAAIERTSFQKMIILVAGTGTVSGELFQAASRRADFIQQLGPSAASKVETYVYKGDFNSPYWLHAKLWIFDDEFAVIGSSNCNRRGYSYDSELGVGIADPERRTQGTYFAHRLRMNLWLKHLNGRPQAAGGRGNLRDDDVRDFVAASKLWSSADPKQSLLERVDFTKNPEPDRSAKEKIEKQFPRAAKVYGSISNRAIDWSFIDPDGS